MKRKFSIALILVALASAALAQETEPKMSPEAKAMMDAWMKYMTPGDAHKRLDAMVGTWEAKVTSWMAPGAPPQVSNGVSENRWVLGSRYLEQNFSGSFNGMPFSGIGYTGYDNAKKEYFGTWMDNMSTGIMTSTGNTADGKIWSYKSTMTDPMTGRDTPGETKITVADADHQVMEMWGAGPDGKMFKMMQIEYSRKK